MDWSTRNSVTAAASLAGIAFVALLVGVPVMLNDLGNLETQLAQQHKNYMDMSNKMWKELMDQGEKTRMDRSAYVAARRERRQYDAAAGGVLRRKTTVQPDQKDLRRSRSAREDGTDGTPGKAGDGPVGGAAPDASASANPYEQGSAPVAANNCGSCPAGPPGRMDSREKKDLRESWVTLEIWDHKDKRELQERTESDMAKELQT
uniref:Nematode cuticle collagen N-terminal domain-containing protein n=1 Tax=Ditylenchus dipsaci TaxID=166011 RepID=A0A915E6H3_9BILA